MNLDKKKILFISARFPYPLHKGDQLVLFNNIRLVSERYEVTLLTMYDDEKELENIDKLQKYCKEIVAVKRNKIISYINICLSIFRLEPLQVTYYLSGLFKNKLNEILKNNEFDLIHAYMLRMAHYIENNDNHKIISLVDSMHLNMSRRVENETGIKKLIFKYETLLIKNYEKAIVKKFDKSIVVSEIDKKYIGESNIEVIHIGVDLYPCKAQKENKKIIFTGNMGYFPNQNAVKWFVANCFDDIKKIISDVEFVIVGKNPPAELKNLHDNKNIFVKGFVESISDELCSATIAIAPMQSGSGMQIKVLEAMSVGLPVVATSLGRGDIGVNHNKNIVIADTANEFANECIALLQDSKRVESIGREAKEFIEGEHSWKSIQNKYFKLYDNITR